MWICCWASTACATATRVALAPFCTAWARLNCIRSLVKLGPEPLFDDFDGEVLFAACRGKTAPIKTVLMDNMWWWVGNIYANEALFAAGVRPPRPAGQVSREECQRLAAAIRATLLRAIEAGGSTLRDFTDAIGKPGYFQQHYAVYGRDGLPCHACATLVQHTRLGQRSSFTARIVKPDPNAIMTRPTHCCPARPPVAAHLLKPACAGRAVAGAHRFAPAGGATPRRATRLVRKPRTLNIHLA